MCYIVGTRSRAEKNKERALYNLDICAAIIVKRNTAAVDLMMIFLVELYIYILYERDIIRHMALISYYHISRYIYIYV